MVFPCKNTFVSTHNIIPNARISHIFNDFIPYKYKTSLEMILVSEGIFKYSHAFQH